MGYASNQIIAAGVLVGSPFVGSFIGLAADRLPAGKSILLGRSRCDACDRVLGPVELIPILSWLAQGGRCRGCRAPISATLPLVEIAAVAVALAAVATAPGLWLPLTALFGWCLLLLALLDAREFWLPASITLPLGAVGLAVGAMAGMLLESAIGLAVGFLALEAVRVGYLRATGREGIGGGDPLLLGAAGAWLGWTALPAVLLIASVGALAAAAVIGLMRGERLDRQARVPLGAWIAAAAFSVWCIGPLI